MDIIELLKMNRRRNILMFFMDDYIESTSTIFEEKRVGNVIEEYIIGKSYYVPVEDNNDMSLESIINESDIDKIARRIVYILNFEESESKHTKNSDKINSDNLEIIKDVLFNDVLMKDIYKLFLSVEKTKENTLKITMVDNEYIPF